jgi:hypothetical protein
MRCLIVGLLLVVCMCSSSPVAPINENRDEWGILNPVTIYLVNDFQSTGTASIVADNKTVYTVPVSSAFTDSVWTYSQNHLDTTWCPCFVFTMPDRERFTLKYTGIGVTYYPRDTVAREGLILHL